MYAVPFSFLNPVFSARATSSYNVPYGFQSMRADLAVGVQFADKRDYSPGLMRWLQVDPKGFEAGDTNLYRFVFNQPLRFVDPSGQGVPAPPPGPWYLNPWTYIAGGGAAVVYLGGQLIYETGRLIVSECEGSQIEAQRQNLMKSRPDLFGPPKGGADGGPKHRPRRKPKRDCQAQWENDLARCARIAKEMKRLGKPGSEISDFLRKCNDRANGRKSRCESGNNPDSLPPWPAPPGIED